MTIIRNASALLLAGSVLSGCVAVAIPAAVGIANLAHKSGTAVIVLSGPDGLQAFGTAAVTSGCTVPARTTEYARAECSDVDVKVEAQALPDGTIRLLSGSLSNLGRTYELTDNIGGRADLIADAMVARGMTIVSRERNRAI